MRILAIDYGLKRIGIAISDEARVLARPLKTMDRSGSTLDDIAQLVEEQTVATVVVGIPVNLDGAITESTQRANNFADKLEDRLTVPIVRFDEALTSREATEAMIEAGVPRTARSRKGITDAWAAAVLLRRYLESL